MCGEGGSTHTHDTHFGYLVYDFFRAECALLLDGIATINGGLPFVSLYADDDSRLFISTGIEDVINLQYPTGDG